MFAPIFIALLSVVSALPSNIPHECMEEIQQKYAHHLAMSKDEASDHTAIMMKVMKQIDLNKCKNVQIKIKINDDKPESEIQNVSNTQRQPESRIEEKNKNSYKVEYKDELREEQDEYILNVNKNKETYEGNTQNKSNFEQNDSGIKEIKQVYSSTQKNIQYKDDKNMGVEPTDVYKEYDYEIYDENSKQFYNTQTGDYENSRQEDVTQRRSNIDYYIYNQQYRPQSESNFRYYNNKRRPQYNQQELNNHYNNRRLYNQRNSNTDYYGSNKSNMSYGKAFKEYSNDNKTDLTQEPTEFRNKNSSGVDQVYYGSESEDVEKDDSKAEKASIHNSNMMNKYNNQQNNAENTNISHETSTATNKQRESNTDYYDFNKSNMPYDIASMNYSNDKVKDTQKPTKLKNENISRDDNFYYDFESEEVVKDNTNAEKNRVYKGNMMNIYNSQNNTDYTYTEYNTSTAKNIPHESNTDYYDSNNSDISYGKTSKNYRNNKLDLTQIPTKFKNENSSRGGQYYYDFESEEVVQDGTQTEKNRVHNSNMMNKKNNKNVNYKTSTVTYGEQTTYSYDITSKNSTTKTDFTLAKDAIEQATDSYKDKDGTYANNYNKVMEKTSDKTSHSKNEDRQVSYYERNTEKSTDYFDKDTDYFDRNKDFFSEQSKENYSDKIQKISEPRGMENNDKWHIVHYPTEKNNDSVPSSDETSHETYRDSFGEHKDVSDIRKPDTVVNNQNRNHEQTKSTSVYSDELKKENASPGYKSDENNKFDTTAVQHITKENSSELSSEDTSAEIKIDQTTLSEVKQDKIIIDAQTETDNLDQKKDIGSIEVTKSNDNQETNYFSETNLKHSKQTDSNAVRTQSNDDQKKEENSNSEDENSVVLSKEFSILNNPISLVIKRQDTGNGNSDESSSIDFILKIINAVLQAIEYVIHFFFQLGG